MSIEQHTSSDNIAKILVIGDTGSGKSTLINYLYNYFQGGDLLDLKIAIPCKYHPIPNEKYSSDELNLSDNTQSKTISCTQYTFTDPNANKQYLFLDTPGLSDTRGIEQSEMNMNKIIDAITGLGYLTTVMIVTNGSISRLTTSLRSIIACLNENIPDIILENIIVVLTNVKKHESPFDLKILNLHGKVYPFYMQNNAFVSDPQTWTKSIREELEHDWNYSIRQIKQILQIIDSLQQISIDAFIEMKQIRTDIKFIIHQVRLELLHVRNIQYQLSQLDSTIQQADRDIRTYQDSIRAQTIDAPYHSTLCTPNHYHGKKVMHASHETLYNLKDRYAQAYENRNSCREKIFTISETKQLIERLLKQKVNELKTKTMDLYRLCSSIDIVQEVRYLIEQLQIDTDLFENLETRLQSEQVIRTLTSFMRSIEENQEKYRRKRPAMEIIDKNSSMIDKPTDIHLSKSIDLVELHKKTTDRTLLDSISEELYRRVQGKSTVPLSTSNDIMIINKYLEKYKQKSIHELSYSSRKLQRQINDILNSNIFRIIDVNPELLIENFIVQTLLDEKDKTEDTEQDTPVEDVTRTSMNPPLHSIPVGISHILSAPYPSDNEPSALPALPLDYSPLQIDFRLKGHQYESSDGKISSPSIPDMIPMPMPVLTNNQSQQQIIDPHHSNNILGNQHMLSSNARSSKPDIVPSSNTILNAKRY